MRKKTTKPSILVNYDDSSDEEDDYKSEKLDDSVPISYVLEDEGRRILYSEQVRSKYYKKKEEVLAYKEEDLIIAPEDTKEMLQNALLKTCRQLVPHFDKEQLVTIVTEIIDECEDDLQKLILKQSNQEFILGKFTDALSQIKPLVLQKQLDQDLSCYKLSTDKLSDSDQRGLTQVLNEWIKYIRSLEKELSELDENIIDLLPPYGELKTRLKKELSELDENIDSLTSTGELIKYLNHKLKNPPKMGVINAAIKKIIDSLKPNVQLITYLKKELSELDKKIIDSLKPHGQIIKYLNHKLKNPPKMGVKNTAIKEILNNEIKDFLKDGFFDDIKHGKDLNDAFLLKKIKDQDRYKKSTIQADFVRKIDDSFGLFFAGNLQTALAEIKIQRKVLRKTYSDTTPINSPLDLYAKEHLVYRSAIRQSRNGDQEVTRNISFDDENDLTVQKKQDIKDQSSASAKHIYFRGTMQEEVFNLGSYESILKKINDFKTSDKNIATRIRTIYKCGVSGLEKFTTTVDGEEIRLSEHLNQNQKQTLVELVELFFGTEGFRSPSAIAETNMALDLIIAKKLTFEEALTGKKNIGRGGELSFTMKSSDQKEKKKGKDNDEEVVQEKIKGAGGIAAGRLLSEDVNKYHIRKHKYGGEPMGRDSEGYAEYLSRKEAIVQKWVDLVRPREEVKKEKPPTKINPTELRQLIRSKDQDWYNANFQEEKSR